MTQHVTRLAKSVLARDKIPVLRVAQREAGAEQHVGTWFASVPVGIDLTTTELQIGVVDVAGDHRPASALAQ